MTRRWLIAAASAGTLSLALHAGGLATLAPAEEQTLAGGPTQLAMVGNGFEDAVAGTISSATDPEPIDPSEVHPTAVRMTELVAVPRNDAPDQVMEPAPTSALETSPSAADTAMAILPTAPTPIAPEPIASLQTPLATPTQRIAATAAVPTPMASATPAPLDTVVGQSPPVVQTPTAETPRPQQRLTRPGRTDPPAPRQPQGNAQETTRVGRADGAAQGTAARTQRGDVGQAAEDGRAIARYPQQVLRRLSRIRPPNSEVEAAAVVAFTLTSNGGLAQLFVARSSGSAEFDRLALAYVQRAVPFPAPPIGAQRRFNVTVRSP